MQEKIIFFSVSALALVLVFCVLRWKTRPKQTYPYTAKHLLTRREYRFYLLLREIAQEFDCLICPKVGLKDLMSVTDKENYMKYFYQISQKHVDFVICDADLYVLFAIELDDSSHLSPDARKRDRQKNQAFAAAGIPLKRITKIDRYHIRKLFLSELPEPE